MICDGVGGWWWLGHYLEADDHGQGVSSFDFSSKKSKKRALSPEVKVGGLNLNFNPSGEGRHDSTWLTSLYLTFK